MDFYGNIDLRNNEMQQLVLQQESGFPVSDVPAGTIVFNGNTLYMAVALNVADPIWIPLTNELDTYIHEQNGADSTWSIIHSLNEENVIIQIYDSNNNLIIPDTVTPLSSSEITVTFSNVIAGRAIVMYGQEVPANGVGILTPLIPWIVDLNNITYDNISFSVSTEGTDTRGIQFNNTGTKMYIVDKLSSRINQYTLSTAYNMSTASYDSINFNTSSQETQPTGIVFAIGGTKMYIVGLNGNVRSYTLSIAYDISSAVYDNIAFSVSAQDSQPYTIDFNDTGTQMYILGGQSRIFMYNLSIAYDISTASYAIKQLDVGGGFGMRFNNNGTKLYRVDRISDNVKSYTLGTAYDVSTGAVDGVTFSIAAQQTSGQDLQFSSDGTKMFIIGTGPNSVHQYSTNI